MVVDIGERIVKLRQRRGWTQEKLSEESKVSVGVVKKLERGGTARIESYHKLAKALRVQTVWFTEPAKKLLPEHDTSEYAEQRELTRDAFRTALMPDFWRSFAQKSGEEDLDTDAALDAALDLDRAYLETRYDEVAINGPSVINTLQLHLRESTERTVELRTALSLAFDATGRYLSQVQSYDLAWLAANRGVKEALGLGDQDLLSQLRSGQAMILIRLGNFSEVEDTCSQMAAELEPKISAATHSQLAAWGRALLWASAAAARNNRSKEAFEYVSLSRIASSRLECEMRGHTTFGVVSTAAQEVEISLLADRPDEALRVVLPEHTPKEINKSKYNHLLLDRAVAAHRVGNRELANETLGRIQRDSPQWVIHSSRPRRVVREIISDWNAMLPESTRRIAKLLEVPLGEQLS